MGAQVSVPVDLLNPGQVFACIGLAELTECLNGSATGGFDWSDPEQTRFWVKSPDDADPVAEAIDFLAQAEVAGEAPPRAPGRPDAVDAGTETLEQEWKVYGQRLEGDVYPIPAPNSLATWPALLLREGERWKVIDHWGDGAGRDKVKFWAGGKGIPGARLLQDAMSLIRGGARASGGRAQLTEDPFGFAKAQSSSLRFDWRRDYVPIDAGFSLNEHKNSITAVGYPLVEVLAAIGLSHARPIRPDRRDKLLYRYGVVGLADDELAPLPALRAGLGSPSTLTLPFPFRSFRMDLDWPGQEGQARCITHVTEEF